MIKNVRANQSMKQENKIFSFWEPKGSMTPYLELCRKTWKRNLPDYEIIFLDYSNIGRYLPEETYDMNVLRSLSLMMQKDAIMVGVLKEHGGVFMDADTLVTADISPLVRLLKYTEAVMFGHHCAFLASRPGAHLLALWQKIIQERLNYLGQDSDQALQLKWDYLANSALDEAMDEMIARQGSFHMMQRNVENKFALAYLKITKDQTLLAPWLKMWINRIGNARVYKKGLSIFILS